RRVGRATQQRLFRHGCQPQPEPVLRAAPGAPAGAANRQRRPRTALTVTGPNGQTVTFDAVAARLTWSTGGHSGPHSIARPTAPVRVSAPNGKIMTVTAHAQVVAATLDSTGGLWYLQIWAGHTQLMHR